MLIRPMRLALLIGFAAFPLLAAPPEVPSLDLPSAGQLSWDSVTDAAGYHVYRGDLATLGTGGHGACLLGSLPGTAAAVPQDPPAGKGFFYLVGAFDDTGSGPVGFSSSGAESFPSVPCIPNRRNFAFVIDPASDGLGNVEPPRNAGRLTWDVPNGWVHVLLHSGEVRIEEAQHHDISMGTGPLEAPRKPTIGRATISPKSLPMVPAMEIDDLLMGAGPFEAPRKPTIGRATISPKKLPGIGAGITDLMIGAGPLEAPRNSTIGRATLSPKGSASLPGTGDRFDGKYLVAGVTHKIYSSALRYDGPFGHGWEHRANDRLRNAGPKVAWFDGQGHAYLLEPLSSPARWESPGLYVRLFPEPDGSFVMRFEDGSLRRYHGFDGSNLEGALTSTEDPDGRRTSFLYDHQGLLTTIVDRLGRSLTLEYDDSGRILRETDYAGRQTVSGYDAAGNRISGSSPELPLVGTKSTRYQYATHLTHPLLEHNLTHVWTPKQTSPPPLAMFEYGQDPASTDFDRVVRHDHGLPGAFLTYAYAHLNGGADPDDPDIERRLTIVTDRNGNIQHWKHNAAGHPLSILQQTNRNLRPGEPDYLTRHAYDADGRLLETTSPAGNRHVFLWDSAADLPHRGNLLQVRRVADPLPEGGRGDGHGADAPDIVWNFTYEPVRNQLLSSRDPRGHVTSFQYDYQEGDPDTNGLSALAARFSIDLSGVPLELGDLNGDMRVDQGRGRCVCVHHPPVQLKAGSEQAAIEGDTTQDSSSCYRYNDHGQLVSMTDPEGNEHRIEYHPETDHNGDGVPTPPPADGRTLSRVAGGYPRSAIWDSRSEIWRNNRTNPPPVYSQLDFSYDERGNVTRLVDPRGVAFEWIHNLLDQVVEARLATATYPATGRGEAGLGALNLHTRYEYDLNDNLVKVEREDVGSTRGAGSWVERRFEYDPEDHLVKDIRETTTGLDVEYRYGYDANGNQVLATTPEGVQHTMSWDERDLLLETAEGASGPRGGLLVARGYAHDGNGNLIRIEDGRGGLIDLAYDGFDRHVRTVDQAGGTTELFHDDDGNVVRVLKRGTVGGPTPSDRSGSSNVDLEDTLYAHDERERVTRADSRLFVPAGAAPVRPPVLLEGPLVPGDAGINRWLEYDKASRPTFDHRDSGATTRYDYDGMGRLVRTTHPEGSTLDLAWDPAGNLVEEVETELSSTPGPPLERFFTTHLHDALGRSELTVDNVGNAVRRVYDSLGAVVATSDPRGPLTATIARRSTLGAGLFVTANGHGNVTRYTYDSRDRLVRQEQILSAGGQGDGTLSPAPVPTPANPTGLITSTFDWSADSLRIAAHDGKGHTTTYTYDNAGRLVREEADDGTATACDYDGEGNLRSLLQPGGALLLSGHDPLNRRVSVAVATPSGEGTTRQTYEYDGLSRLTRATDDNQPGDPNDNSVVTFLYDSLGRPLEESGSSGGGAPATASMQWLAADLPHALIYPSGGITNYSYDAADRLQSVLDPSPDGGWASYQYFGLSRVHTRLYGNGARSTVLDDSATADIGFDGARRVTLMRHLDPNGPLMAGFEYRYDRAGNRTSQRRPHHFVGGATPGAMGELYQYDSAGRLTGFQERALNVDHVPVAPSLDAQTWSLDAAGNWAFFTRRGVAYLNTPNNNNEYDEPQSGGTRVDDGLPDDFGDSSATSTPDGTNMSHDMNGNRTSSHALGYVYDGLNRLVRVEQADGTPVASYSYDALGRRTGRYVLTAGIPVRFTRYWGGQEIEEVDGSGLLLHEAVHAHAIGGSNGGIWKTSGGGLVYILEDALGSAVGLVDGAAPVLLERVTYDPYGKPTFESPSNAPLTDAAGDPVAESPGGNHLLFAGMRYDPETGSRSRFPDSDRGGKYQTWHRTYSPDEGRFLTRDPLGAWADPASGGNAYAYAGGNPINAADPLGLVTVQYNPKEIGLDKPVPWRKGMYNPKEVGLDKPVTWQKGMYNPKEIGLDKSVPWQKGKNSHREYALTKSTPWKHHDIQGLDAPTLEFTSGEPYRCQFELFFDRYEEGKSCRSSDVTIRHDHVYQHNQTDLEFIRTRASRQEPRVIVRGWDPKKK